MNYVFSLVCAPKVQNNLVFPTQHVSNKTECNFVQKLRDTMSCYSFRIINLRVRKEGKEAVSGQIGGGEGSCDGW